ncbi:Dolichyl-phosphate-mannose-protein mannosyltransferase [Tritrichomonas foetus]|uniref:Dolichyl-phosphate-mannose-protein mannosyltransferase n=1 Tax=Tritrichomonas foetus TaxID=1144522 RepID=A0A1J4KWR3_9EUKA|nr:Dolichyl-phosphate-mannose-protein mannosyltransferase [Tritrichomonas foetus]|eukprot:OHT15729.1 Dolichyl-phosphate-mannose-protein mannosyltransferase [Tritrichomonas foetus]
MKSENFQPNPDEELQNTPKSNVTQNEDEPNTEEEKKKSEVSDAIDNLNEPSDIIIPFNWNGYDAFCLMILIFFGVFSRFWIIQYPRHMVYREEHQIHIINSYLNGSFFLDTEPPFASMLMAGVAWLSDYNLTYSLPRTEVNYSYHDMQYVTLRSTPAFFSTIVIPVAFYIVRSFGGSRLSAFSAGLFTLFDFLLISLGRNIFTDGIIQFLVTFSIFLISVSNHFRPNSSSWITIVILESIFVGLSISSTISALGLLIFAFFFYRKNIFGILANLIIPLSIFILCFCYQVILMPYHSQYDHILSDNYQIELFNLNQEISIKHLTILPRAIELIQQMFVLRKDISTSEQSEWFYWPFMGDSWFVLWTQLGRYVSCFGNVAIWWPICFSIVICFVKFCFTAKLTTKSQLLSFGYLFSLLFFAFGLSQRGLCDYEIPLLFGIFTLALFIDEELSESAGGFVFTAIIAISGFLFVLWAPLVYGYENFDKRFLPYFASFD